jgi:disulfide bond formation protein DsbB
MIYTPRNAVILLAILGSAALLLGAYGFQFLGGLAPCKLCLWQRWPHAIAIAIGVVAILSHNRLLALAGALTVGTGTGIALYHSGVEQHWWPGPDSCTSTSIAGLSPEDLLAQIMAAPPVRCDEIVWQFAGLSMPAWNGILSALLAGLWIIALSRKT